jgi:hypothetical protein
MPLTSVTTLVLDAVLEKYIATRIAPATPLKPNLVAAAEVASREFGAGSGHHKAIIHILCALEGEDPSRYIATGFASGDFLVLEAHSNTSCAQHIGEVGLLAVGPDSDTDCRMIGVWDRSADDLADPVPEGETGVPCAHAFRTGHSTDAIRLKTGKWRRATAEEATALIVRFKLLDEKAGGDESRCLRAVRASLLSLVDG